MLPYYHLKICHYFCPFLAAQDDDDDDDDDNK